MMKRLLIMVLLAAMLIGGCGRIQPEGPSKQDSQQEEVSQVVDAEESQTESVVVEEAEPSILDGAVPISEGSAAY